MLNLEFNVPSERSVRDRLVKGYRARRNFLLLELFTMVVMQTPYKTGKARGGWIISIGSPSGIDPNRLDTFGGEYIVSEMSKLRGVSPFKAVVLENNVDYIKNLEEGSSGQAPDGILRVVVPAWRSMHGDVE